MPLFTFLCQECLHKQEHFVFKSSATKTCPKCNSSKYSKESAKIKMIVEYTENDMYMEKQVDPYVNDVYERMGKEALNFDTKTAENMFGREKVEKTFHKEDD